ncbi:MAG TPA: HD domain-containing phosphohydrolase, partial [Bryobacteraceae bacterium]|nr:HD domain-containing phosphohydrolase [Bryobacteraceae bacterium]
MYSRTSLMSMKMSLKARLYWLIVVGIGLCIILAGTRAWDLRQENLFRLAFYLGGAIAASGLKIRLPGVLGARSMSFLFIIGGLLELQLESAVLIGVASVIARILIRTRAKSNREQILFSAASIAIPIAAADWVLKLRVFGNADPAHYLALISASTVYFLLNTSIMAIIIGLTTEKWPFEIWRENLIWTSPQYLLAGALAGGFHLINGYVPWQAMLLTGPPLYVVYRSCSLYLGKVEQQQQHITQMADLHWRTIEALALAIEAKDDTTVAHLKRVRVYAVEMARELGLSEPRIKALEAASLLHDIGKLAVPEYITSKPGRLTSDEFEKMKIHPIVGAEILERVSFPWPVVPIVRSHHEKFDGTGYPDGLRGEEIPIGARILSAVDCLDALASDRHYRRAVPLETAMEMVARESGKAFDPLIVDLLKRRYKELEIKARSQVSDEHSGMAGLNVECGLEPAAGFAQEGSAPLGAPEAAFTMAIANARREVQLLVEMTSDLGNSLSLDETLALLAVRLGKMVPHDAIVIYIRQDGKLIPQFVQGENHRMFSTLEIPVGQGLSGWVVENNQAIVNGNPAVEPGYLNDPQKITTLRSAVSVPLPGQTGVIGALTLYRLEPDAFTQDHLRVLRAISPKAGVAIENSLRFRSAKHAAEKDELTGVLNAGALFRLLTRELLDASDRNTPVAIIVLDLDGFKQANDLYGHVTGNRVLQEVARGLRECCRRTDHVARLGGDEFVLVLPDADAECVRVVLNRISDLGPEAGMKVCGTPLITVSSGVATYPA